MKVLEKLERLLLVVLFALIVGFIAQRPAAAADNLSSYQFAFYASGGGYPIWPVATPITTLTLTGSSLCTAELAAGKYWVQTSASVNCRQATSAGSTAVAADTLVGTGIIYPMRTTSSANDVFCCVGTATVYVTLQTFPTS